MILRQLLLIGQEELKKAHISSPLLESRILLSLALKKEDTYILLNYNQSVDDTICDIFFKYISRRCNQEPIAYITGKKEFYGYELNVDQNTLIPRPETELIIDFVIKYAKTTKVKHILDLGCGSGNISIALAKEIGNLNITAVDFSDKILNIATTNAKIHQCHECIKFVKTDWFDGLKEFRYDIIISNPPYISEDETNIMAIETLRYEPREALFGENGGIEPYEKIIGGAHRFLKPNGLLIFEIGFNLAKVVSCIAFKHNFYLDTLIKDINLLDRVLIFRKILNNMEIKNVAFSDMVNLAKL